MLTQTKLQAAATGASDLLRGSMHCIRRHQRLKLMVGEFCRTNSPPRSVIGSSRFNGCVRRTRPRHVIWAHDTLIVTRTRLLYAILVIKILIIIILHYFISQWLFLCSIVAIGSIAHTLPFGISNVAEDLYQKPHGFLVILCHQVEPSLLENLFEVKRCQWVFLGWRRADGGCVDRFDVVFI